MSTATIQVTASVDKDVTTHCPSDKIYFSLYSQTCTQSRVTPANPATPGTDQVLSAATYSGCPFNSCCYKDSDIKWDLYYKDDAGLDVKICRIHFHEPWSTSWHNCEITYYDMDDCQYDIMIKTVSDVDRSTKCELTVRPKPQQELLQCGAQK